MRNLTAAILAMAFATLGWQPALANRSEQPTMEQLANEVDEIDEKLDALTTKLDALAAAVGNLATEAALQSLTAEVASHTGRGEQMAIFMTDPTTTPAGLYHIGESTIPGFPPGPKDAHGRIGQPSFPSNRAPLNPALQLPAGSYLFELQQPRTDNVACIHSVTQRNGLGDGTGFGALRYGWDCPSIRLILSNPARQRSRIGILMDGAGVFTTDGTESFSIKYYFPTTNTFAFTRQNPRNGYIGAVRVTKLK